MAHRPRVRPLTHRVAADALQEAEAFCQGRGAVRGTALPLEQQVIRLYAGGERDEQTAAVGDWIVRHGEGDFEALTDEQFQARYVEDDGRLPQGVRVTLSLFLVNEELSSELRLKNLPTMPPLVSEPDIPTLLKNMGLSDVLPGARMMTDAEITAYVASEEDDHHG